MARDIIVQLVKAFDLVTIMLQFGIRTERFVAVAMGKALNANFLASTLCVMEDTYKCLFHHALC